jgi:superfamily II DNA or RNA helicase
MDLVALSRSLAQVQLGHLLEYPLGSLRRLEGFPALLHDSLSALPAKDLKRATRTVLLDPRAPTDLRSGLEQWLRSLIPPPPDPLAVVADGVTLTPGMPVATLDDWARRRRVTRLLDHRANDVLSRHRMYHSWSGRYEAYSLQVRQILVQPIHPEPTYGACPIDLQNAALTWLMEQVAALEPLFAEERRVEGRIAAFQPDRAIAAAWKANVDAYWRLRNHTEPGLVTDDAFQFMEDPPTVVVGVGRHWISWNLEAPPKVRKDVEALAAVTRVMDLLTAGDDVAELLWQAVRAPTWQRDLKALDAVLQRSDDADDDEKNQLAWVVDPAGSMVLVHPARARVTRTGTLQTRIIPITGVPEFLRRPEDEAALELAAPFGQLPPELALDALERLVGHPRVVWKEGDRRPVSVRVATLRFAIDRRDDHVETTFRVGDRALTSKELQAALAIHPRGARLFLATDHEIVIAKTSLRMRAFAEAWVQRSGTFPLDQLGPLLARVAALQQHVTTELDPALIGDRLEGDARPVLRVAFDRGLVVEARCQPLPDAPSEPPGQGPTQLFVVRDGKAGRFERHLDDEVAAVERVAAALGLDDAASIGRYRWAVDDVPRALDVIRRFDASQHRTVVEGQLPSLTAISARHVSLTLVGARGWFDVGGRASTELGDVSFDTLMAAIDENRGWIEVGKGFARIEDALVERLRGLAAQAQRGGVKVGAVHAPLLAELAGDGATVEGPPDWATAVDRIRAAQDLAPALPDGLVATLRAYQLEGFQWLARLATWAPGAILADDMGLGKTVQAIALMLHRSDAPTLVVAPTSVGFNWEQELARFAPSLRIRRYAGGRKDRSVDGLGAGDVVVTSYGVLVRDVERLSAVPFGTLILDEAQAIKNASSQRAKAAFALDAAFRVALSGTPVENRSEELWSLTAATVPGLLGGQTAFREKWAAAVDSGDTARRAALSRLIRPFMLRRTKREVAPELPPRTEIAVRVAMEPRQRALYERARREAVARLESSDPRKARFQVLAELTKLRQLAADPRLVDPGCGVEGAKVHQLARQLADVRDAGGRALVFSLFVSLLELVRPVLEAAGLRVAWLTGSTPADQRAAEVRRFQKGDADVFLISLKAGGTGLNLTAASYVFHLDPWWNPAAEDQATDRAHRIGQDLPVTVYRLIAQDTVEERILEMHRHKRELVDALVEGGDSAVPLGADELVALLSSSPDALVAEALADDAEPSAAVPTSKPQRRSRAGGATTPIAASAAPSGPAVDWSAWLATGAATIGGRVSKSSAGVYQGALRRFVSWASNQPAAPVPELAERYLAPDNAALTPSTRTAFRAAWSHVRPE